jgi:hypothetical protein
MIIRNLRSGRRLAVLAIFAIVAVSALGFAASNTVPTSNAGDGFGTISGFTASDVHYGLDATDPTVIDTVEFTLAPAPAASATVKVRLDASTTDWYNCTMSGADATCSVGGAVAVLDADELRVVAAD